MSAMNYHLKKIENQVIVVTGASSGIGLATAEAAAEQGAKVVLIARSGNAIQEIADRLNARGLEVMPVKGDVTDRAQLELAARATVARFGTIDTWVNNAGLGLYGRIEEVDETDSRRLFDVNFWGVVHGSLAALPHLKKSGGALINIGSEVSESFIPLMGMYTASKHAVKGFTDALRCELEVENAPVSVTLVEPTAVDTPFPHHARNYQPKEPALPPPLIDPDRVARAILRAAAHPTRTMRVGLWSKVNARMALLLPTMADRMAMKYADRQHTDEEPRHPEGTLTQPCEAFQTAGHTKGEGTNRDQT